MRKIIILLSLWSASITAADLPIILDPVVNATPPGAQVTAGYLTLINETSKSITITGAYSPTINKVEIHLSSIKNDVASMEKQDAVTIDVGEKLVFAHGSYHLMLMDLTQPLKENDMVDIVLITSSGDMLLEMPVKKLSMNKDKHANMKKGEQADMDKTKHSSEDSDKQANSEKEAVPDAKTGEHNNTKKNGDTYTGTTKVVR